MRLGKVAQRTGERVELAHRALKAACEASDYEALQIASQAATAALNDWARICQIPFPPRPKENNRPMIDIGALQELPDDSSLVESLRSKPAQAPAPAQPATTPEPASPPIVDVDQSINPG